MILTTLTETKARLETSATDIIFLRFGDDAIKTAIKVLLTFILLSVGPAYGQGQGTIDHVIVVIKENRSTDELFGTLPGVHNYCQGGNSPLRQTTDQSVSCTRVGTRSGDGWCEPIECIAPNDPEGHCSGGDICPQITKGKLNGSLVDLVLQDPTVIYLDLGHAQSDFISELSNGAMNWSSRPGLKYFGSAQIPYYYSLASTYGLADNHFSTMGGPSLPNHAYLFAISSGEWSDNATTTIAGASTDPGEHSAFTNRWTCGASHAGIAPPYTYIGDVPSTQASDGTQYYAGVCTNHQTTSCECKCAPGQKCSNVWDPTHGGRPCSTDSSCTALNDTCTTHQSIGGTNGAPCLQLTTIADQIEATLGSGPTSWGYYSHSPQWTAPAYFQNLYFDNARWKAHIHQDTLFDTDASSCTGMCSNNHATACTIDPQCGSGTCIDSDGTPPGSQSCTLPKIAYVSPTADTSSDHPGYGSMSAGEQWTKDRLTAFFSNPYVYNHSVLLLTWDDWGGYYDHVPPPVQDAVPTLGFRVPLMCVGPYCRNRITHTQLEFASVLKCLEDVFGLGNINARDAAAIDACAGTGTLASNTDGMVDLSQSPIPAIGQTSDPTTTSVQASVNPSSYGLQVTFTANVTSASATPTGTVTFLDGGTPIGSNTLSQGSTSISRSDLLGGTHSITAAYGGDPICGPSTSAVLSEVVNPAVSSTTVQSSQNPSVYGQGVTFTATVSGVGVTPTGDMTFYDGTTALGSSVLNSGQATLTTSSLSVGSHSITGIYSGDSNYSPSTSAALTQAVNQANTTTSVTSSLNPSAYNQSINFTATVSSPGGVPTGSVNFNDGATTLGTASLNNGTATLHNSSLVAGSHNITASYGGDPNFQPSTSVAVAQTVNKANSTTSVVSNINPSSANQSVTLTATVTSQHGGAVSGSVTFNRGSTPLSTVPLSNGSASYTTPFNAGSFSITAVYSGDSNNQGSTSAPLTQQVNQASSSTTLVSSRKPSWVNQSVTFTATVASQYGEVVTGGVTFTNGTTLLSTVPLAAGQASYTKTFTTAGTRSITATYSGDSNNLGSTSPALSQVVNPLPASTTTALTSSRNPSFFGQSVAFRATITSPYGPIPDGYPVNFFDGSTALGSAPTTNAVATYTTSSLSIASHVIKATFVGDATYASSSKTLTQVVKLDPTITSVRSSLNPSKSGNSVTFTATVSSTYGPIPDGELVTFSDGATTLGSVPLAGGVAAYSTSSLTAGTHTIKATYAGDATFASSSSSLSQVVN